MSVQACGDTFLKTECGGAGEDEACSVELSPNGEPPLGDPPSASLNGVESPELGVGLCPACPENHIGTQRGQCCNSP